MIAFLGRYGSVSPAEYEEMDARFTRRYAAAVARFRQADLELMVNLARFVAGAKIQYDAEEVRG